jgi:pyruvate dehydrogenase complex dehydrogenase (E1) component
VVASLEALAESGEIGVEKVGEAIARYGLDAASANPWEA